MTTMLPDWLQDVKDGLLKALDLDDVLADSTLTTHEKAEKLMRRAASRVEATASSPTQKLHSWEEVNVVHSLFFRLRQVYGLTEEALWAKASTVPEARSLLEYGTHEGVAKLLIEIKFEKRRFFVNLFRPRKPFSELSEPAGLHYDRVMEAGKRYTEWCERVNECAR